MCEILVRAVDGTCGDQTANPLKGYPVTIRDDGHQWGLGERLPEYVVFKVPGVSFENAVRFTRPLEPIGGVESTARRRRYRIPEVAVNLAIANGGTYTVSNSWLINNIIDQSA
jgi:hypothetical protein